MQLMRGGHLLPVPKETLAHIFFDCPMISNILSKLNNLISNNSLDLVALTNVVWLGVPEKNITAFSKREYYNIINLGESTSFLPFTRPNK